MKKKPLKHLGKLLLAKQKANPDDGRLNGYAFRRDNGGEAIEPYKICFSGLCATESKGIIEFVFSLYNRFKWEQKKDFNFDKDEKLKRNFNEYVLYILNESPFRDFFITKRICDANRYGVKCNTKKTLTEYLTGCVAIREYWEQPVNLSTWNMFVKAGIHKDIALILSYQFQHKSKDEFKVSSIFSKNHGIFGCSSKDMLSKFLTLGCCAATSCGYSIFATTRTKLAGEWGDTPKDPILAEIQNPIKKASQWSETVAYKLEDIKAFALQWESDLKLIRDYK